MQPDLTQPVNVNNLPSDAERKLISMFGSFKVQHRQPGQQRAYLTILKWLHNEEFQPIVKLELHDNELILSYVRMTLVRLEPRLSSIERSFKHLKPYSMYVRKITRGDQIWKEWGFRFVAEVPKMQKVSKRQQREDDIFNLTPYQRKCMGIEPDQYVEKNESEVRDESEITDGSHLDEEEDIIVEPQLKKPTLALNLTDYDVSDIVFDFTPLTLDIDWEFVSP
jgi:hypothetical protein